MPGDNSRSSVPWPVWAAVTIIVAALPFVYQYLKGSKEASPPQSRSSQSPQFTLGTWTLHDAVDDEGTNWSNSTLKITSQNPVADGLLLEGFFEWRRNEVTQGKEYVASAGTEYFSGRYLAANRQVILEGHSVTQDPAYEAQGRHIGEGSYSAILSEDGRSLIDGIWGSAAHRQAIYTGHWHATR